MTGTDGQSINLDDETAKVPKYSKPNITILNKERSKSVLFEIKVLRFRIPECGESSPPWKDKDTGKTIP